MSINSNIENSVITWTDEELLQKDKKIYSMNDILTSPSFINIFNARNTILTHQAYEELNNQNITNVEIDKLDYINSEIGDNTLIMTGIDFTRDLTYIFLITNVDDIGIIQCNYIKTLKLGEYYEELKNDNIKSYKL